MNSRPDAEKQLASLSLAVVLLDPDLAIGSANPAAEQLLGISAKRMVGRRIHDVLDLEEARIVAWMEQGDAPLSAHAVEASVAGQGSRNFDLTLSPISGSASWQVLTLQPSGGGDPMEDTEASALRAPAILAHEIKNPLSAIRGAAQLLGRKAGEYEKPLTTLIADEVDRIAKLVDRMQSLGREKPEPVAPCNLHEVIRRARAVVEVAGDEGVQLVEEFDPSLPLVLGNADALVQVLINLISNARDACKAHAKACITIRTRFSSGFVMSALRLGRPIKLPITLRISDNGPGIDPTLADHIFEPFVSSKKNGQGLGLALVKKLVRDMNGRITLDRDQTGGWTHFSVHLPMAKSAGGAGAP